MILKCISRPVKTWLKTVLWLVDGKTLERSVEGDFRSFLFVFVCSKRCKWRGSYSCLLWIIFASVDPNNFRRAHGLLLSRFYCISCVVGLALVLVLTWSQPFKVPVFTLFWLGLGIVLVSNLSKTVSFCCFFSCQGFSLSGLDNNSVLSRLRS